MSALIGIPRTLLAAVAAAAALVVVTGCGTSSGPSGGDVTGVSPAPDRAEGRVSGKVFAGPSCPVEDLTNPCPDEPVAEATVSLSVGGDVVATGQTDQEGKFSLAGPAGRATLIVRTSAGLAAQTQRHVTLTPGRTITVSIALDIGIRRPGAGPGPN